MERIGSASDLLYDDGPRRGAGLRADDLIFAMVALIAVLLMLVAMLPSHALADDDATPDGAGSVMSASSSETSTTSEDASVPVATDEGDGLSVESLDAQQATATIGVVLYDNTPRYSAPSTASTMVDYVNAATIVSVTSYDDDWYTGTSRSGETYYVQVSYVRVTTESNTEDRAVLKGVVTASSLKVYIAPAKDAYFVRTYVQGQVLKFNKYCDGWYMGYVTDGAGDKVLGFVSEDDLGLMDMAQDTTDRQVYSGTLTADPTNLYLAPSTSASVIKTVAVGATVRFSRFNDSWYMGTLSDGTIAYLSAADVNLGGSGSGTGGNTGGNTTSYISYTRYGISLTDAATAETGYAYNIYPYADVLKCLDPASYLTSDAEFYQFLKLEGSGGFTAAQIDAFLSRHDGVLVGEGQDFIDAANAYNINVAYLIAHAVLETGWGTSTLARGYVYEGQTYYNFYGYGASDGNALEGGRQWAINKGWNSKRAAIMGAASLISINYVYGRGQDTVYEIRWAPAAVSNGEGGYQYATGIYWPSDLGQLIGQIYSYCSVHDTPSFDVPVYAGS